MQLDRDLNAERALELTDSPWKHVVRIDCVRLKTFPLALAPCCFCLFITSRYELCIHHCPTDWYRLVTMALQKHAKQAKRRIVISTLYIGTGSLEAELVSGDSILLASFVVVSYVWRRFSSSTLWSNRIPLTLIPPHRFRDTLSQPLFLLTVLHNFIRTIFSICLLTTFLSNSNGQINIWWENNVNSVQSIPLVVMVTILCLN